MAAAAAADDADVASRLGLGFPADTGGVLSWAERQGLDHFVRQAQALAAAHSARFEASP